MGEQIWELIKIAGLFGGIFGGIWLVKRGIRWFGPAIKLIGQKPWR